VLVQVKNTNPVLVRMTTFKMSDIFKSEGIEEMNDRHRYAEVVYIPHFPIFVDTCRLHENMGIHVTAVETEGEIEREEVCGHNI